MSITLTQLTAYRQDYLCDKCLVAVQCNNLNTVPFKYTCPNCETIYILDDQYPKIIYK